MARLDFNNDEEKALVEQVFVNAMEALSQDDQQLPQVQTILPLLKRGVGKFIRFYYIYYTPLFSYGLLYHYIQFSC